MKRLLLTALLLVLTTQVTHANCSDLALVFSESPDDLEINELALLKKCVSDKLQSKLFPGNNPIAPLPMPEPGGALGPEPNPSPGYGPGPVPPLMPHPSEI